MLDLHGRQAEFNAESRGQWDAFEAHRRRVSALLGAGTTEGGTRLCVLGAGNCNDLELPALLASHREVHLVDLDPAALDAGVARQGVADHPSLVRHGGIDVTGMLESIGSWSPLSPITDAELNALAQWPADRVGLALPGPFDHVASTCLLSQLLDSAYRAIGDRHPRFRIVVRALRDGHLRLLARLVSPGGRGTLITDVTSSEHFPPLPDVPEHDLADLLPTLERNRAYIAGVLPRSIIAALRAEIGRGLGVIGFETIPPWRWRLHSRIYLVWALRWRMVANRPK